MNFMFRKTYFITWTIFSKFDSVKTHSSYKMFYHPWLIYRIFTTGECPIPRKPGKKIKLISLCRGRSEKKHFEINDFLNFIVAHSFSINCRGSESNWILRRAFIVCDVQDQDFYIANFDK